MPLRRSLPPHHKESRIGQFWLKYGEKMIPAIGVILIAAVCFEAGYLQGQKNKNDSVVVNETACAPCPEANKLTNTNESPANSGTNNASNSSENIVPAATPGENQNYAF